jgi:hypothetical protein
VAIRDSGRYTFQYLDPLDEEATILSALDNIGKDPAVEGAVADIINNVEDAITRIRYTVEE